MTQIISSLHDHVTPEVLSNTAHLEGSDTSKKNALSHLYSVLATSLAYDKNESRLATLDATNGDALLGTLVTDTTTTHSTQGLYEAIATQEGLPVATVSALATEAMPKAYNHIKTTAGTKTLPTYLASERDGLIGILPATLLPLLPAGLVAVGTPVAPATEGVLTKTEKESGSAMKALLPIIGALILAALAWALLKGCQKEPAAVATPVTTTAAPAVAPAAALSASTLAISLDETGNAMYSCDMHVGSTALGDQVRATVNGLFSADKCHVDVSPTLANEMPALQYVPQVLQFMQGVPDAYMSVSDKTIMLNASDATALEDLVAKVKAAVPSDYIVLAEPVLVEADAITAANTAAAEAVNTSATIDELVRALNLQVINFAVDSAEIPAENKAILDVAAERIKMLPDAHLKITGHTDNTASHAYNKELSERRANAVHDYLVSLGVSDDKLDTFGASFDEPIATNATEQGRFRNRRIEFTLLHGGDTVTNVAGATAATVTDGATAVVGTVADTATDVGAAAADAVTDAGAAVANAAESAVDTVTTNN